MNHISKIAVLAIATLQYLNQPAESAQDVHPELRQAWMPVSRPSDPPGGRLVGNAAGLPRGEGGDGLPNLSVTSIQIVDASGNPTTPVSGKGFWVRVNYRYDNPICTEYVIRRTVNAWTNDAPPINWGCNGGTSWWHFWGAWVIHKSGRYSVTVTLDADNAIAESDETDNSATIEVDFIGDITAEWALVGVEDGLRLLGDGTDVIVGTMDDAFDFQHPWLNGTDSLGRPRLVASNQNSWGPMGSPVNAGHATAVMGIVLARGSNRGDITGLAPDARYVTAEFINRANIPGLPMLHVLDAAGFLAQNGAEVINMSWSWWFGSDEQSMRGETAVTNLMADYLAYGRNIVCVPAVNQLPGFTRPTAPGSSRNVITVGGLDDSLQRAWIWQDHGPTLDGRGKPDLLGNDAANAVAPVASWRAGFPAAEGLVGTSFSAPFVTGAVAQMLDYGKHNGQSTDHRVIKAVIMNSGVKALDANGDPWSNTSTQPLDDEQGTGILDLVRVHAMYSAGEQGPGSVTVPGYDLGEVIGHAGGPPGAGTARYRLGRLDSTASHLSITLVWDRHTFWDDINGNGRIDSPDSFYTDPSDQQDNLDLALYRDNAQIAISRSVVDNIEYIALSPVPPGRYELEIRRMEQPFSGDGEVYAVAWHADGLWMPLYPGDLNCDGAFNGADIDPFFLALGSPAAYAAQFPNCDRLLGDMNRDGRLDGGDIDQFFAALGGG